MASASELPLNLETTIKFVKLCASKFEWGDLSEDTVMDLGCGKDLYCARTIIETFPNVKSVIALDGSPTQLDEITFKSDKIIRLLADIRRRTDIRQFEGKIDKIISTHVLHQIPDKEKVLKNVYRLLKPGGVAAFLFTSDFGPYHILERLSMDYKYSGYFKGSDVTELYSSKLKAGDYREMLERLRFNVIEITEEKDSLSPEQYGIFENTIFKSVAEAFTVPSELVPEINEAASRLYKTEYCDQKSIYIATEMSIFVKKPSEASASCSNS